MDTSEKVGLAIKAGREADSGPDLTEEPDSTDMPLNLQPLYLIPL